MEDFIERFFIEVKV
ncbi:uncharacterized protein FTOL_13274 [Fusarium torulosum]|uniref:Uncharacterized protein n=1 Tax=Fusarium torulosum TaxID=33205 RepID=A0AAE8SPR7_9HYPO|nr:uncharacterized protein FTOL_13274 [Fusarium torulosum]